MSVVSMWELMYGSRLLFILKTMCARMIEMLVDLFTDHDLRAADHSRDHRGS